MSARINDGLSNEARYRVRKRRQRAALRSAGWCGCGMNRLPAGFVHCDTCRAAASANKATTIRNRKKRGDCYACGRELDGRNLKCESCRQRNNEAQRRRRARLRQKAAA